MQTIHLKCVVCHYNSSCRQSISNLWWVLYRQSISNLWCVITTHYADNPSQICDMPLWLIMQTIPLKLLCICCASVSNLEDMESWLALCLGLKLLIKVSTLLEFMYVKLNVVIDGVRRLKVWAGCEGKIGTDRHKILIEFICKWSHIIYETSLDEQIYISTCWEYF